MEGETSQSDADTIEAALLAKDWVGTAVFPVVDESSKPALAASIAASCVLKFDQEPDILIIETCSEIPIYSPGIDVAEAAAHDLAAIVGGQPFLLHYESGLQKEEDLRRGWYCSGEYRPSTDPLPTNCDEFPFYTTVEGGPGASLVNIAAPDNQTQGNQLSQFYTKCGLVGSPTASESNQFLVIPNPGPSVGICGVG